MTKETSGESLSEPWRCVGALEVLERSCLNLGKLQWKSCVKKILLTIF